MTSIVDPSFPPYTTSLSYLLELLIYIILENEYDSVTRAMFLRCAALLHIPYFLFLSYEETLIVNLNMVAERLSKDNASLEKSTSHVSVVNSATPHTQKKGKWLKIITTGAIAGTCAALSGFYSFLFSLSAPLLLPAAVAAIGTLTGFSFIIGGSVFGAAVASALTATSAFLSSSAGVALTTTGLLAGGSWYGG